ncbi:BTB/POZ domain-containing protein [Microdochium nivale]|nr:BTB/POZ domain-containing protein [Microdochium nivale]
MLAAGNYSQIEVVVVDSRGDLLLQVGGGLLTEPPPALMFKVCSRTLARQSPVFDKMLFGGFTESKPDWPSAMWTVKLPDDDVDAMKQLLGLMHGDWTAFSIGPEFTPACNVATLYDLLVLLDKYDCVAMIRPWAHAWIVALDKVTMRSHKVLCMLSWIYYQLGHKDNYETVVRALLKLDAEVVTMVPRGLVLPPELRDSREKARITQIEHIISQVQECMDDLLGSEESRGTKYCQRLYTLENNDTEQDRLHCANRILGALVRGLVNADLWPIPNPAQIPVSPNSLRRVVESINTCNRPQSGHEFCSASQFLQLKNPQIKVKVHTLDPWGDRPITILQLRDTVLEYRSSPAEVAFMASQAEKTKILL